MTIQSIKAPLILTIFFFLLNNAQVKGQIYETKSSIIQKYGKPDTDYIDDAGINVLLYKEWGVDSNGNSTPKQQAYYLKEYGGSFRCYRLQRFEPLSDINDWVRHFEKEFVKTGALEWKDYESNLEWSIEKEEEYIIISTNLF